MNLGSAVKALRIQAAIHGWFFHEDLFLFLPSRLGSHLQYHSLFHYLNAYGAYCLLRAAPAPPTISFPSVAFPLRLFAYAPALRAERAVTLHHDRRPLASDPLTIIKFAEKARAVRHPKLRSYLRTLERSPTLRSVEARARHKAR